MTKNFVKKISIFAVFFLFAAVVQGFSKTAEFKTEAFEIEVSYAETIFPGDALFIKLKLHTENSYLRESFIESSGNAKIYSEVTGEAKTKALAQSDFYSITKKITELKKQQSVNQQPQEESKLKLAKNLTKNARKQKKKSESRVSKITDAAKTSEAVEGKTEYLLTGIPLSTYFKTGDYTVVLSISPFGSSAKTFEIPLTVNSKAFISETIQLDARNTAIRSNDSDERWQQIKKLNAILDTKNKESIYTLEAFEAPTKATRRTSFFGDRRVFAYNNGKSSTSLHYGIDYGIPRGSEVRACADGKVVMAETRITTGWTTVIEHLPGLYSLYYHQDELKCNAGDIVKKGDLIGLSGMTGLATGPHLHWEMRLNMEAVNPDFFVKNFDFTDNTKVDN